MLIKTRENTITVCFKAEKKSIFPRGTSLLEILKHTRPTSVKEIVLAKVNNRVFDLYQKVDENCLIEWLPIHSHEGMRSYQQTLCLVIIRVVKELYPSGKILIDHSLGKGFYCEIKINGHFNRGVVKKIKERMSEIIQEDEPIQSVTLTQQQALNHFQKEGENSGYFLGNVEDSGLIFYRSGKLLDYLGYPLLISTGYLKSFELQYWPPGMILRFPEASDVHALSPFIQQKKLFQVFHEYSQWEGILGIQKVGDINETIIRKKISDLVKIAEGLHEKKIAYIADTITKEKKKIRVVLIAGPSSSGKTTFAKRLNIQLRVNGLRPVAISLDDYFKDKDKTPKDDEGKYDFESLGAVDVPQFNLDLKKLLQRKEVLFPRYDFKLGKRVAGQKLLLDPNQPILVEGLHCLNNKLIPEVSKGNKLKIYVSALTQLNITDHLRVPTSDVRLLRRLVRDHKFRGYPATQTLENWPLVRRGEEKHIFPFQEEADIIFNSALIYELSVLRSVVEHILTAVSQDHPTFPEARRLLQLLLYFMPISPDAVPPNSILREFIGESSFHY